MALPVPRAPGFTSMLKEGAGQLSGVEEAVIRSIEACNEFSRTLKTSYGPRGLNKMVINHLEKLYVTNDAATIVQQLDVQHPAAKILVMASQMIEKEVGDSTNYVIMLAGALLEKAEELIRMGLKPIEIVEGYEMARDAVINEILPNLVVDTVKDFHNLEEVKRGIRTSIASKQFGYEDFLADLIGRACILVMPKSENASFNVDNVRVCKILGSGVTKSELVQGMIFKKSVEGSVTSATDAKVVVYTCPVDVPTTETKGTVLIQTAQELTNFSRGEEVLFEKQIQDIAESGAKVIVSGGKFGDMALHYCNKYGLMAVRLQSKFDVRRLCKTVGAVALPKLQAPKKEELGFCDNVYIDEIGGTSVVVFKQSSAESKISTIVVRGSSDNVMDDIERAIDDGVNTFKALTKDGRLVAGAGASDIEMVVKIASLAETLPGLEQYAVGKFAEALQSIPVAIAENAGIDQEVVTKLFAAHQAGDTSAGIDINSDLPTTLDAVKSKIFDLYLAKYWAIKYAVNAANTVLQVDHIIWAKPAGGPKPRQGGGDWDQD
ncbi:T-complex protein 1 subunit theta [Tetranychus urticae]|uniref:T-complex protein 1 subunit theta n=1 Tax=Tetranychus urticae TaxID=32264 RepID=T1L0D0_TETUR|nr:T-complex protein 1 subunit theta [Tetranychus urticae]